MTANKTTISCKISGPVDMNKSFRSPYRRFLAPFLLSFLIPIVTPEHINDDANITNSSMVPTANILTPAPTIVSVTPTTISNETTPNVTTAPTPVTTVPKNATTAPTATTNSTTTNSPTAITNSTTTNSPSATTNSTTSYSPTASTNSTTTNSPTGIKPDPDAGKGDGSTKKKKMKKGWRIFWWIMFSTFLVGITRIVLRHRYAISRVLSNCWFIFRDSRFVLYSKVFFLTAWNLVVAGLVRLGYLLRLDRLLNSIRNSRSRYRPQPNMGDGNGLNELLFDTNSNDMQEGLLSNNGTGQG